jgi:Uma2 family endonuclease
MPVISQKTYFPLQSGDSPFFHLSTPDMASLSSHGTEYVHYSEPSVLDDDGIIYPESDGQPMADNTKQFQWIVALQGSLDATFKDDPNIFVAGDLLWYPIKGDVKTRYAPDAMVVFGRPKGDRGSYQQWKEDNIAPQVVFEVISPGNTVIEMMDKLEAYDNLGVEEFYLFDPDRLTLKIWARAAAGTTGKPQNPPRIQHLTLVEDISTWKSPRLGIVCSLTDNTLVITRADGTKFETYLELYTRAEQERERAEQERNRAERERERAERERERAITAEERANAAEERTRQMAARLQELGINPDTI